MTPRTSCPADSSIGLVGYSCRSGLGEVNRQAAAYLGVARWLVVRHARLPTLPTPSNITATSFRGEPAKVAHFLRHVDTLLFFETPFYGSLMSAAKRAGKRVVCVPMLEWTPTLRTAGWMGDVDLFLCPTRQCYDALKREGLPVAYCPWPVDTARFPFTRRETVKRFLFINGHGGWGGRKGAEVVKQAKRLWPELPLTVISQKREDWPADVTVLPAAAENRDLYREGDVLISPHSVDGLGLEPMEAMASGLPVVTTDGEPWNELPALARIPAKVVRRVVKRPMPWYLPDPAALADLCRGLLGKNIGDASDAARAWAESRAFPLHAEQLTRLIRGED